MNYDQIAFLQIQTLQDVVLHVCWKNIKRVFYFLAL